MSLSVCERDAVTIRDAVHILAGRPVYDWRGTRLQRPRTYSTNRAYPTATGAESYGSHFPLFHYVPRNGRHAPIFLVNGDEWRGPNSRTRDHQSATRTAIAETGLASVVVPFTALQGAGIDLNSVRIVDVRPDENWTETRTAERLQGVPRHERTVHYSVDRTAETLEQVPTKYRTHYRELSPDEKRERDERAGWVSSYAYGDAPLLPNAETGLFEWTERRTRDLEPNAETGLYEWTVRVHRLGECLISAVREIAEPIRPARPCESSRDTARERVTLQDSSASSYCSDAPNGTHESGPAGACVTCGAPLFARSTWKRRARYLSAFDTNEVPPLYFLAEVPRTAGDTVSAAFDSLAPRAVHAAYARGLAVARQGDIFLVPTNVELEDLERRGIRSRARLTMWTRGARPRKGETGYSAPLTAGDRRELYRIARRHYRKQRATLAPTSRTNAERLASRRLWNALLERQAFELGTATLAGLNLETDRESSPCEVCGARIGEPCGPRESDSPFYADLLAGRHMREPLARRHPAEREGLRTRTLNGRTARELEPNAPHSPAGVRARFAVLRATHAENLETARARLRRAVFHEPRRLHSRAPMSRVYRTNEVGAARGALERLQDEGPHDSHGNRSPAMARDSYRRGPSAGVAVLMWRGALEYAHERLRPELYGDRATNVRERVRDACSIYGTAHSATDVVTLRSGAVYARGTVHHVPDLERGRFGERDHRPVYLGNGERWYLAVRNAVPRQALSRRSRRQNRRVTV